MSSEFLERIENQLIDRFRKKEELKENQILEMQSSCPFTPALTNQSRKIANKKRLTPIHKRYKEEFERKERKIEEERQRKRRIEEEKIKRTSRGKKRRKFRNSFSRDQREKSKSHIARSIELYKNGKKMVNRKRDMIFEEQSKQMQRQLEEDEELFKPKINKVSRSVVKTSFEQRQKSFRKRKSRNKRSIMKRDCSYSFTPRINKPTSKTPRGRRDRGKETSKTKGSYSSRGPMECYDPSVKLKEKIEQRERRRSRGKKKVYRQKEEGEALLVGSKEYLESDFGLFLPMDKQDGGISVPKKPKNAQKQHSNLQKRTSVFKPMKSRDSFKGRMSVTARVRKSFKPKTKSRKTSSNLTSRVKQSKAKPGILSERSKNKSGAWKRLYVPPGKTARGPTIVAARPEKDNQAALTYNKLAKKPPRNHRKSFKHFKENLENFESNERKSQMQSKTLRGRKKGRYGSMGNLKARRKNFKEIEASHFEEFCDNFQSIRL